MRKSKLNKVIDETSTLTEREEKTEKKLSIFLWICFSALAVTFIIISIIEPNINGYDEYMICYDYKEIEITEYDTHYPHHDKFLINYNNKITKEIYNFEVFYDEKKWLLGIKNNTTNDIVYLDYNNVYEFEVIENSDSFTIVIHSNDGMRWSEIPVLFKWLFFFQQVYQSSAFKTGLCVVQKVESFHR